MDCNEVVHNISDNDCGMSDDNNADKPPLPPHTISCREWETKGQETSRQGNCFRNWPLACQMGFITNRAEYEWDEEKTSSGDSIYLGSLPEKMINLFKAFHERVKQQKDYPNNDLLKEATKKMLQAWKDVEEMSVENARNLQKVIAAQVNNYKKLLKGREAEQKEREVLLEYEKEEANIKNPINQSRSAPVEENSGDTQKRKPENVSASNAN